MEKHFNFNSITQFCIVTFTLLAFLLTAFKLPQWGLVSNIIAQPFWLYSSYKSWRNANQIGAFITTIIAIIFILFGIINYWLL